MEKNANTEKRYLGLTKYQYAQIKKALIVIDCLIIIGITVAVILN
ncbi:MAG: hypothetical protein RJQ14_21435 [Marinoscillum sp.]